jgi:mRNA degradation ribonuclease J1/J2
LSDRAPIKTRRSIDQAAGAKARRRKSSSGVVVVVVVVDGVVKVIPDISARPVADAVASTVTSPLLRSK